MFKCQSTLLKHALKYYAVLKNGDRPDVVPLMKQYRVEC